MTACPVQPHIPPSGEKDLSGHKSLVPDLAGSGDPVELDISLYIPWISVRAALATVASRTRVSFVGLNFTIFEFEVFLKII